MISPYAPTSLLYAATDRKHRPLSHPVVIASEATEEAFYAHIAHRIWTLRKGRGWSQRELGARLGVSGVSVCRWERGDTRPTAWNIHRLERVFSSEIRP